MRTTRASSTGRGDDTAPTYSLTHTPPLLRAAVPAPEKLGPTRPPPSYSGVAAAVQADVHSEKAPDDALARELRAMGLL